MCCPCSLLPLARISAWTRRRRQARLASRIAAAPAIHEKQLLSFFPDLLDFEVREQLEEMRRTGLVCIASMRSPQPALFAPSSREEERYFFLGAKGTVFAHVS